MPRISRRRFVGTVAAASVIPFSLWFEQQALAGPPLVRYDAASAEGQAMLKLYAEAVKKMMGEPEGNPKGWLFQWYSHFVKGSTNKAAEIARIYGANPSAWKTLALATWDTCQAHSGQPEDYFLPWHRMFVYFFESIIRSYSSPKFTLPYWNYSVVGPAHGVMPKEFRVPADPLWASLYQQKRNAAANNGTAIDQGQPDSPLGLQALAECPYSQNGADPGFCLALDSGLHGNVHVLVGNGQNMGSVPWAAEDPIFWMHHCNIDRLWASWNKAGRQNNATTPGFLAKQFTFADAQGTQVVATVKNFLDIAPLNYTYDKFEPVPPCPKKFVHISAKEIQVYYVHPGDPVELGALPVTVELRASDARAAATPFAVRVRELGTKLRLYLVVKDLHAAAQPGILYHIYLDLPKDTPSDKAAQQHVGTINFFDAVAHGGHTDAKATQGEAKFFSFDVTDLARRLVESKVATDTPTITIAPAGEPEHDAKATIGNLSLVAQ